ncbi:hypothetical protein [uncultured Clostridium sp.]|uniref:hypothetical protein n=1 Tax=uncultured Clostridium sp. TaxID=59620 RepID=UPI002616B18A|nr:hypothetical protein [uncultured Clostridium sp.]
MDNLDKRLKGNKEEKVPKNIDDLIENTLASLEKKSKKKNYKKAAMVASLSAVIFGGIGLGVSADESDFSVNYMLYNIYNNELAQDILIDKSIKKSSDNIDFEIMDAGYYDNNIMFTYKITSKKYVKYLKSEMHGQYYAVPTIMYKNERISGSINSGFDIKSDNEVIGTCDIEINRLNEIKESDSKKVTLAMEVYTKKDEKTEFLVDIPVEKDMFIKDTKTYEVSKVTEGIDSTGDIYGSKLRSIKLEPLQVTLDFNSEYGNKIDEKTGEIISDHASKIEYIIFDDKGKEVELLSGSWDGTKGEANYKANKDMKKLYIVPTSIKNYSEKLEKDLKINISRNKIEVEDSKDFKATVEEKKGFRRVTLTANTDYLSWPPAFIQTREREKLYQNGQVASEETDNIYSVRNGLNSVYYDIPNSIKRGEYIFDYQDLNRFEILKDKIIEVDLIK